MYDDYKSMDVQLICNQCVVTYNKLQGMKPMGLSTPWFEYIEIFFVHPVKNKMDEPNGP